MKNKIVVILLMCCTAGLCYSGYGLIKAESKYISAEVCYETLKERRDSVEVKTEKIQSEEDSLTRTMKDINEDYIGWITIANTKIDYPIVHSNPKRNYLNHDFYGDESVYGTLFIRHGQKLFENRNTVIYGHNMKDGGMFAALKKYLQKSWFEDHPDVKIQYSGQVINCKVFSVQIVTEDSSYPYIDQFNDADYEKYLIDMVQLSRTVPGELPDPEYPIITLSTCYGQERLIVMAQYKEEKDGITDG